MVSIEQSTLITHTSNLLFNMLCWAAPARMGYQALFSAVHCASDQLPSCPRPQPSLLPLPATVPQKLLSLWFHPLHVHPTQSFKARTLHPNPNDGLCLSGFPVQGWISPEQRPMKPVHLSILPFVPCWQAAAEHYHQPNSFILS